MTAHPAGIEGAGASAHPAGIEGAGASAHPPGRKRAALTLIVLTPVIAELGLGSTPVHFAFLLVLWLPIYGFGVLLIREAVRRVGGGWSSLVLLGVAYELVEDGIGLQALSSPHLYGAAQLAPRLFGLNTAYWEVNAIYHVVFSVLIPIALTDLIFPAGRDRPYLRRGGLVGIGIGAVVGVGLLRVSVPPSQDPGYTAPLWVLLGCLSAVALLAVLALAMPPRLAAPRGGVPGASGSARPGPDRAAQAGRPGSGDPMPGGRHGSGQAAPGGRPGQAEPAGRAGFGDADPAGRRGSDGAAGSVPRPWVAGAFGAAGIAAFLALWFVLQHGRGNGAWALVPMAAIGVLAAIAGWLVARWGRSAAWSDRHRIWLLAGALVTHSALGAVGVVHQPVDRVGLALIAVLTAVLLAVLARRRPLPAGAA
ncbi:hypothetical protein AB0I55_06560 [Actinocatenispora sera]|uniref:hypothetical protein n=1 Tax=Actinocatenispora sera TaxID=390989 RepID=UPI0034066B9C